MFDEQFNHVPSLTFSISVIYSALMGAAGTRLFTQVVPRSQTSIKEIS
jgi:hypothetical protein